VSGRKKKRHAKKKERINIGTPAIPFNREVKREMWSFLIQAGKNLNHRSKRLPVVLGLSVSTWNGREILLEEEGQASQFRRGR